MIRAMQGWMAFPFRLVIAIGIAWMLSSTFHGSGSKLDLSFLSPPQESAVAEMGPVAVSSVAASPQATSMASKIGISASVALVLYVWVAYEWVGFARFERACSRLKKMGAIVYFEFASDKPFWLYYFRAQATVDLSKKRVNEEHLKLLKGLPNLTTLVLANAKIPENFFSRLRSLKRLKTVDVQGLSLTDRDRSDLAQLLVR